MRAFGFIGLALCLLSASVSAQTVKQITQFPEKTVASATDNVLTQPGGVGTPYVYTPVSGLLSALTGTQVTTALGFTPLSVAGGTMTGPLTLPGLTNSGNQSIAGTLSVTGLLTATGGIANAGNGSIGGTLSVTGLLTATGGITNAGNESIAGTLGITGLLTATGGITNAGHAISTGTAPTLSACGGSPTLSATATDIKGTITEGTTATGCTLTFHTAYATAPDCVLSSPNGAVPTGYTPATGTLTITNASASGDEFTYYCIQ